MKNNWGIYGYVDKNSEDGEIVYIGIDRNIDRERRRIEHESNAHKDRQHWHVVYHKDPSRYEYVTLAVLQVDSKELAYLMETACINQFNPIHNVKKQTTPNGQYKLDF